MFSKLRTKWVLLLAAALVMAIVTFLVVYEYRQALAADNVQFATTTKIAALDSGQSNFDQAAQVWLNYAATSPSTVHKQDAYTSAAAMYLTAGQSTRALSLVQTADKKFGETYLLAEIGGEAAQANGNKALAISFYQTVVATLPNSLSDKPEEVQVYQQSIQQLEQSK